MIRARLVDDSHPPFADHPKDLIIAEPRQHRAFRAGDERGGAARLELLDFDEGGEEVLDVVRVVGVVFDVFADRRAPPRAESLEERLGEALEGVTRRADCLAAFTVGTPRCRRALS